MSHTSSRKHPSARWRNGLTVVVVGLQVFAILLARWVPERFFCWAPYDALNDYAIVASMDGQPLSDSAILQRYEVSPRGRDNRSIAHLTGTIRWVEERARVPATVELHYTLNGGEEKVWRWPTP